MSPAKPLQQIFDTHVQALALTLRRGTVACYRFVAHRFRSYLHTTFPQVRRLSQLRRDPHLLGWSRWLCEQDPPIGNVTRARYLFELRRLFRDIAANGPAIPLDLIRREDFPPHPHYLPRPLSPEDDRLLIEELERADDLHANALLRIRTTGIRISECIHLAWDCLRQLGPDQWALHVPLGKLYTERLVPADAAKRAGCSCHLSPHRLRHTCASEMIRLGVSLPALMQLLGHKDIHMTLRYVQVTQQDLQREFHMARQIATQRHITPGLPLPGTPSSLASDRPGVRQALAATRHLLEMYRRQLGDEKARRKLQRLDKRLLNIASALDRLATAQE